MNTVRKNITAKIQIAPRSTPRIIALLPLLASQFV
jgi:hypothetical protein